MDEMLRVLQPERARGDEFMADIRRSSPTSPWWWRMARSCAARSSTCRPLGSINVHASLLPELRGAAPINWAIKLGHERTGITIMRMVEEMDAGRSCTRSPSRSAPDETASDLWSRLSEIGAAALIEALALLEVDELDGDPQDDRATYAPRLTRDSVRVDWRENAVAVARHIRAMDAIPGAWTRYGRDD
jgi:methionyl-tRNA formyltransferase